MKIYTENAFTLGTCFGLRSVYGSTNPYVHVMTMLSNKKTTFSYIEEPDVEKIPLGLTLYEVSVLIIEYF